MKKIIENEKVGLIEYDESFWTGKKKITINGTVFTKSTKKEYIGTIDGKVKVIEVTGNQITGLKLGVNGETVTVYPAPTWYEWILFILPFILVVTWGNSKALCGIVPVVGGAIGGLISAACSLIALLAMKAQKNPIIKVVIGLAGLIATFVICTLIGYAILSAALAAMEAAA